LSDLDEAEVLLRPKKSHKKKPVGEARDYPIDRKSPSSAPPPKPPSTAKKSAGATPAQWSTLEKVGKHFVHFTDALAVKGTGGTWPMDPEWVDGRQEAVQACIHEFGEEFAKHSSIAALLLAYGMSFAHAKLPKNGVVARVDTSRMRPQNPEKPLPDVPAL
jgi:hypothetical protein